MSVELKVILQEREADALIRAADNGRGGWNAQPSLDLQRADFKIITAIHHARADQDGDGQ